MRFFALLAALLGLTASPHTVRAAPQSPCHSVTHEDARYTVCEVDPTTASIRLFWQRPDGAPYATLGALPPTEGPKKSPLLFAMNAGMYHADLKPVGLYVEGGRELTKTSTKNGPGNFHLKPNGVFFVSGGRPGVLETTAFLRQKPKAEFATQSGPMLVIDGKLHPKFIRAEASQKMRNGVGVDARGHVHFAISEDGISFASFGRLYRDVLKCPNALFLDGGSVPTLYAPAIGRGSNFLPLGPMLAVYGR